MPNPIIIRGGGDLATGVALRLHRSGFPVIITELPQPLSVRRAVSFSEAVYEGKWKVEDVTATLAADFTQIDSLLANDFVPVVIDPDLQILSTYHLPLSTLIDARLTKHHTAYALSLAPLIIGLGPGFTAGENCHAAIETQRGHNLGRVYWSGSTSPDTGQPDGDPRRVLRAPADGIITTHAQIGDFVTEGQLLAEVDSQPVIAPLPGVLRGLIRPGLSLSKNLKIGDIDPRGVRDYCYTVSDKALAIGGAVLEVVLSSNRG
jgi:xanthine dehydrogenase accessory factor